MPATAKVLTTQSRVNTIIAAAEQDTMNTGPFTVNSATYTAVNGMSLPLGIGRYVIDVWLTYIEGFSDASNKPGFEFTYTTGESNEVTGVAASGNLLQGEDAGFEGGLGNWVAGSGCSIYLDTSHAHSGSDSMGMFSTGAGNMTANPGPVNKLSCQPGQQIWASMWFHANTVARSCRVQVDFFDINNNYLTTLDGPNITDSTSAFVEATDGGIIVAPAGAYFAYIDSAVLSVAGSGEVHQVDDVYFGASGTLMSVLEGWFQRNAASDSFGGFQNLDAQPWGGPIVLGPPYSANTILAHLRLKILTTAPGVVQLMANTSLAADTYAIQAGADMSATRYGAAMPPTPPATTATATSQSAYSPNGIPGEWVLVFNDDFNGPEIDTTNNWIPIPSTAVGGNMATDGNTNLVLQLQSSSDSDELICIPYLMNVEDVVEARIRFPGSSINLGYRTTPATFESPGTTGTTYTVNKQAGTTIGDYIFIYLFCNGNTGLSIPGFTAVTSASVFGALFYRLADGTEGSSFTVSGITSGYALGGVIATITGATGLVVGTPTEVSGSTSGAIGGVTMLGAGWSLWFAGNESGFTSPSYAITAPSGYTSRAASGAQSANPAVMLADNESTASGATGTKTGTCTTASNWWGVMVGFIQSALYNHATFWTSGPNWPSAGENDIAEVAGWSGADGALTVNYHDPAGQLGSPAPAGSWANNYHTYALHRKPQSCDVYWDGSIVETYATGDNGQPESVILTLTAQNPGMNEVFGPPGAVYVDYVRAWRPQ